MKILVTGTSAQHYSSSVSQSGLTYAGMLVEAARELGHEVTQVQTGADVSKQDLDKHDKVFVGVTTPLSVSANGIYGALGVISALKDSDKLVLFIDAPEPGKIFSGLRAIEKDPGKLFKPFYARRAGYRLVVDDKKLQESMLSAASFLLSGSWPTTLWPSLPWFSDSSEIVGVSDAARLSFVGLSFDAAYARPAGIDTLQVARRRVWGIDTAATRWTKSVINTLSLPHEPIKDKKHLSGAKLDARIGSFHGAILGVHDDKRPWWSPLFVKALCAGTPIVTEWKYSQRIGNAWSVLAATVEEMGKVDAYELSVYQARQYLDSIQTRQEVLTTLRQVIGTR